MAKGGDAIVFLLVAALCFTAGSVATWLRYRERVVDSRRQVTCPYCGKVVDVRLAKKEEPK